MKRAQVKEKSRRDVARILRARIVKDIELRQGFSAGLVLHGMSLAVDLIQRFIAEERKEARKKARAK